MSRTSRRRDITQLNMKRVLRFSTDTWQLSSIFERGIYFHAPLDSLGAPFGTLHMYREEVSEGNLFCPSRGNIWHFFHFYFAWVG